MTLVIEGLKVTVLGIEVAELARKRSEHHTERVAHYRKHLGLYAGANEGEEDAGLALTTSHNNPKATLIAKMKEHQQQQVHMAFIADHVKLDAEYLLDNGALVTLGVIPRSGAFFG